PRRTVFTVHNPSLFFSNWKASVTVVSAIISESLCGISRRISIASGTSFESKSCDIRFLASARESFGAAIAETVAGTAMTIETTTGRRTRPIFRQFSTMLISHEMQVRLLFFATLKDIVGSRELRLDIPQGSTIDDLWNQLERMYPRMKDYRSIVLTALNEE